jgi:hypothetical protein
LYNLGMNNLSVKRIFLFLFLLSLTFCSCKTLFFHRNASIVAEKELLSSSHRRKKEVKVKEPRYVKRAKKKQEAIDKKEKIEYEKSVHRTKERTFDIQTAEVQARMKKDRRETSAREREKKRKVKSNSKKAAGKYN